MKMKPDVGQNGSNENIMFECEEDPKDKEKNRRK
jgi:hypothetical protein